MQATPKAPHEHPPRPNLEPAPAEWNARPIQIEGEIDWPVERSEARHPRNGFGAWAEYLAIRAATFVLGGLPKSVFHVVVTPFLWVITRLDKRHTAAADDFIHTALPKLNAKERRRMIMDCWRNFASVVLGAPRLSRLIGKPLGEHFDLHLSDEAKAVIDGKEGFVLVSGHLGNWEAIGLACIALDVNPLYGIGRVFKNDPLSRHMQRTREATGGRMLARKGAMKGAPTVIRSGGCVMMLLDHRARNRPVWAPFFGRPAACDRSAGVLLRRIGAPILFFSCTNPTGKDKRFRVELGTVLRPDDLSGMGPEDIAGRVNYELEQMILAEPSQYFWLHDRFKGAPATLPTE